MKKGTKVKCERDPSKYPHTHSWLRWSGRVGTVVEIRKVTDKRNPPLYEVGVTFPEEFTLLDENIAVHWFHPHELSEIK